jgi:uncharacterized metal-binding protein YceD (DUF177 family)
MMMMMSSFFEGAVETWSVFDPQFEVVGSEPVRVDLQAFVNSQETAMPLPQTTFGFNDTSSFDATDVVQDVKAVGKMTLKLVRTSIGFNLVGTVEAWVWAPCQQCVASVPLLLSVPLQETFAFSHLKEPVTASSKHHPVELFQDDFYEVVDVRQPFSVNEVVRQVLLTQIPISVACPQVEWAGCLK